MSMLLLMSIAAGAVAMPEPASNPEHWLGTFDIPESAVRAGENGSIFYKLVVGPDGKVDRCNVQAASAQSGDWDKFCGHVKLRFSYRPAKDQAGDPTYYVLEENDAFVLPGTWIRDAQKPGSDFVVDVARLPGSTDGKLDVAVNIAVDATGKLQQCNAPAKAPQPTLSRLACEQLMANWAPMPERNAAGLPISYVRQMQVEFRAARPAG